MFIIQLIINYLRVQSAGQVRQCFFSLQITCAKQMYRNITNPFSSTLKTNISKEFQKLVDKPFTKKGPFNKILNRNTIKISYSCMPNIESES